MSAASNDRRRVAVALLLFAALSTWLLRDGFQADHIMVSQEILQVFQPWATVIDKVPAHNRFLSDQAHVFYPYLMEAQKVYRGEADVLWTAQGGGGQPWFGAISSCLLHPLTMLCAVLPIELVPLAQAWLVLTFSALFTWLFLRKLGVSDAAAALGALGFGYGGHQVFWLSYALSHALLALPFTFWAIERVREHPTRRRLAVLVLGFALMVFAGHPETGLVAGVVAGAWGLYRLRGRSGFLLVSGAGLLALAVTAVQWLPFLEYALLSRGLHLRHTEAASDAQETSLGAELIFAALFLTTTWLLSRTAKPGLVQRVASVASLAVTVAVALRMGMAFSSGVLVLPLLYGDPVGGGLYTAAQDFPGLNAAYVGALLPLLLGVGCLAGVGQGMVRFFGVVALLFWGTAFSMPGVEDLVRGVPGLSAVQPTRFLGPVGFLVACGGAVVVDRLCARSRPHDQLRRVRQVTATLAMGLIVCALVLSMQDRMRPATDVAPTHRLESPAYDAHHGGAEVVPLEIPLAERTERLRVRIDGQSFYDGPAGPDPERAFKTVTFYTNRIEEGVHRLQVDIERDGETVVLADQPLHIDRARQLRARDLTALGLALTALVWLLTGRGGRAPWLLSAVVAVDVLSLADGYNVAAPAANIYPPTETVAFLNAQTGPYRVFSEGVVMPPDTQVAVDVDHILSYDNVGYMTSFRLLHSIGINWDAFAHFAFSRESADYAGAGFDGLDVRYVLTMPDTDLSDIPGFELVHESETRIWENTENIGRAWITPNAINGFDTPLHQLMQVDFRETAVLEVDPDMPLGGTGTARVLEHTGSTFLLETDTDGDALLVLAENHAPGWTASIDGGPAQPTQVTNIAWQSIPVPAGVHQIRFQYFPASVRWGLVISIPVGLLLLVMWVFPGRRREAASPGTPKSL